MNTSLYEWNRPALIGALALLLNLLALPVLAAQADKPAASLADVVEQAWRLHPQAAGLEARDAEARAAREVANGLTPEAASLSFGQLNDRHGQHLGKQEWEVEMAVALWLPGQKEARMAEADSRIAEVAARRAALRLEIAGEVRTTWGALMAARSAMALATRRRDSAQALNNDVQKRFKVGELSRIDANLTQGEVLAAEAETIESRAALHQAEQAFRLLAGAAAPAELGDESVATQRGSPEAATAAAGHPQLAAVAALADNARARLKLAETTRRAAPELSLRLLRERGYFADPYGNSVGIKLKIPLSAGAQVRRETSLAQAEAEQAAAEMHRTETRVQQEIERAHRAWEGAERLLTMAQERHRLSADNLRLSEKAFALGEADLATLLRIRASALEAESVDQRQRLARAAAIAHLNQALGVLP
jgi:cobalt-zinc-cadmium efflux system outer membrane protein